MRLLIIILLLSNLFSVKGAHIVGGDIYYDYLGNNNYRFYISLYRDCHSSGAAYDNPLNLGIFNAQGFMVQNIDVPFPGSQQLPVIFNNPCVNPPGNICTELATYITVVNLPPVTGGYNVTYQRCCRTASINNLINPDNTGITLTCHVPGSDTGAQINSSPRFTNYPPLLLCNNEDLIFDHSAIDPDGDQLVYSLVTPLHGGSSLNPQPIPPNAPNYAPVIWNGGFSAANPLGGGATINIDPNTGMLTASPNWTGQFVVGIQVQEIRNGVVINQTVRDFIFEVFNCSLQLESLLPTQENLPDFVSYCQGLTINFVNNSYGGTNYEWDFGVAGTNSDVSSAFAPSFTYPANGTYVAMLVVNPGWPCTDTAFMDITVNNEFDVSFTSQDSLCIFGNSFDFVGNSSGPASTVYNWNFGPDASQQTAMGQIVNGVSFSSSGLIPVTITGQFSLCDATFTDEIYIFPEPIAEIDLPDFIECLGYDIDFGNNSQNAVVYEWDFGVAGINTDVSTAETPSYTFPGPGIYTATLIAGSTSQCKDTTTETFTINEPLILDFTVQDSLCITGNSFDFNGTVSGPPNSVFTYDFGSFGSISNSNNVNEAGVVFNQTGPITITLTGSFDNCSLSVTHEIYLYAEPTIDFTIASGLQCAPYLAQFYDLSTAETGINYTWDFGDGSISNEQNPQHLFTNVGTYPISLTIETTAGCINTLNLLQPDIVTVRPNPTAGFILSTDYTDICHSEIQFTDQSQGAVEFFYWLDDSTAISTVQNPNYQYLSDGTHYPYQIVTNEWGCKDTSDRQRLYIEPFTVYAPNTFTPDGDEFNNRFLPIVYLEVYLWDLRIYNRWGNLVFETDDVNEAWDGTNLNGTMVQDGGYTYVIEYVTCEPINPEIRFVGHVNVLR